MTAAGRAGPVVFAGRAEVHDRAGTVVTEALPRALPPDADHWVILDPVAFPHEALDERAWDAPVSVLLAHDVLPDGYDADALAMVVGPTLLERLTPYDQVRSARRWDAVRPRYGIAASRWRPHRGGVDTAVAELAGRATDGAAIRHAKARWRAEASVLGPIVAAVLAESPPGGTGAAIELTDGSPGFASLLVRAGAAVTLARSDAVGGAEAGTDHPELPVVQVPGDGSVLAPEHADLAVALVEHSGDLGAEALHLVWEGLRIGGRLVLVLRPEPGGWTRQDMLRLVLDISSGQAVRDEFVTVRHPLTGRVTSAVFSCTRIGVPARW